ncbi:hypothetical protein [Eudoraea sp.]|uniref:hypothetical protein n=1 Tax=Eudoraea sp. TaxID=1979955 RepID=UPI003C72B700
MKNLQFYGVQQLNGIETLNIEGGLNGLGQAELSGVVYAFAMWASLGEGMIDGARAFLESNG